MEKLVLLLSVLRVSPAPGSRCEMISVPKCQEMPYNYTRMPNMILGHGDQVSAGLGLHHLQSMLDLDCSPYLAFFLCSLVTPMCTDQVSEPVPGCRGLCEHVRSDCGGVFWPPALDCAQLPLPSTGLCMDHPDIPVITSHLLQELPPPGPDLPHLPHNLTLCPAGDPGEAVETEPGSLQVIILLPSLALLLLSVLSLACLLQHQQEDGEELRMLVVSQLVEVTGLLVGGGAGREEACGLERRVVCNLVAMLGYSGHLASLAWWSGLTASALLTSASQPSSQLLQTLVWGSVSLACIATFTWRGVEVERVTGLCHMKEQFRSTQIPTAIFLVLSLLLLVAGWFSSNQQKSRLTTLVSYLYFFIFLGVFISDIWTDIHGPSEPGEMFVLSYFKLSLQFLQIGLTPLIVMASTLVSFFKSKDKTFSSGEISNLPSKTSETRDANLYSRPNIVSTRTLISNVSI